MSTITDLRELLKHELKDLYSAETQLVEALPEMVKAADHAKLKAAFRDHLSVTKEHRKRLNKIQQILGEEPNSPANKGFFARLFSSDEGDTHCKAMEGLIKEANSLMSEDMSPEVMDAALIAAAQKVEHYEISSYGTARAYALQLGMQDVADLLKQTLDDEYFADDSLTQLALNGINENAEDSVVKRLTRSDASAISGTGIDAIQTKTSSGTKSEKAVPKKPAAKKAPSKTATTKKKAAGKPTGSKKATPAKTTAKKSNQSKAK